MLIPDLSGISTQTIRRDRWNGIERFIKGKIEGN